MHSKRIAEVHVCRHCMRSCLGVPWFKSARLYSCPIPPKPFTHVSCPLNPLRTYSCPLRTLLLSSARARPHCCQAPVRACERA